MKPSPSLEPIRSYWLAPICVLALLVVLRGTGVQFAETLERSWLDRALRFRAAEIPPPANAGVEERILHSRERGFARPLDERIRFVEINMDETIAARFAQEGEYAASAKALETMAALGPRVIALDILYSYGREQDQRILADTIRKINAGGTTKIVTPAEMLADKDALMHSVPAAGGDALPFGFVNVDPDPDNNWRQYRLVRQFQGQTLPSLALAAFSASLPEMLAVKPSDGRPGVMEWKTLTEDGDIAVSTVDDASFFLNLPHSYYNDDYDRRAGISQRVWTIPQLEAQLAKQGEPSPLQDAIVFFGYGKDFDGKPTAHGAGEPGMVLHATALNDLLHGTDLKRLPLWADILTLLLAALVATFCFAWAKRQTRLLTLGILGLVVIAAGSWSLIWFGHLIPAAVATALLWTLAFFGEIFRRWAVEQKERTQRDAMLGFYFSPAVLKQVIKDLGMIRPRGGEMAALLSDLRGFTTYCETMPVERVFELLNRLFETETTAALRENGSLSRFAGDQFLAYWGAPEPCSDSADRAMRAALEIYRGLKARQDSPQADEIDGMLNIGIGLHYGPALVGHVGSRQYRDYNIVGDLVNTTARVESQTKNYHAPILATAEFIQALTIKPEAVCLDHVQVKGRQRPVCLHGVLTEPTDAVRALAAEYTAAFTTYEKGGFAEAGKAFEKLTGCGENMLAASAGLLAKRCAELAQDPPQDWMGVYVLKDK
ncbi:MAG: CHASE2 domain-containing protein [Verrucomicrobiales bacterium]|nr:CHASE2 domain-containing protein [Verrucomicrobiales bacterium]